MLPLPNEAKSMVYRKHQAAHKSCRNGTSAVEFAVVAPFILILLFGMIESSWMLMASHATVGAAREATRIAAITDASDDDIRETARDYMERSFFNDPSITIDIDRSASSIEGVENITCTVAIDYNAVSIIGNPLNLQLGDIDGTASMMRIE